MRNLVRARRWKGFGSTAHWLSGGALVDFVIRQTYQPMLVEALNGPGPLSRLFEQRAER